MPVPVGGVGVATVTVTSAGVTETQAPLDAITKYVVVAVVVAEASLNVSKRVSRSGQL